MGEILVWFGKSKNDKDLEKRIDEKCMFISKSAFLKESAYEKLERERLVSHGIVNVVEDDNENEIDSFLSGF